MCNCVTIAWYCLVWCIKTFCLLGKIYENDMLPEKLTKHGFTEINNR